MNTNPLLAKSSGLLKNLWAEFRDFAFKGNMIDLAIAVVLGAAFTQLVSAFTKEIFQPILDFVTSHLGGAAKGEMLPARWQHVNNFISALIQFLINAFAIFILFVKLIGPLTRKVVAPPAAPSEPITKECPMCLSVIPIKARKCAHCTSDLTSPVPV